MDWQDESALSELFAKDRQRREDALSKAEQAALAVERDVEAFKDLREEVIEPELKKLRSS